MNENSNDEIVENDVDLTNSEKILTELQNLNENLSDFNELYTKNQGSNADFTTTITDYLDRTETKTLEDTEQLIFLLENQNNQLENFNVLSQNNQINSDDLFLNLLDINNSIDLRLQEQFELDQSNKKLLSSINEQLQPIEFEEDINQLSIYADLSIVFLLFLVVIGFTFNFVKYIFGSLTRYI